MWLQCGCVSQQTQEPPQEVVVVVITSGGQLVRSEVWLGALRLRLVGVQ